MRPASYVPTSSNKLLNNILFSSGCVTGTHHSHDAPYGKLCQCQPECNATNFQSCLSFTGTVWQCLRQRLLLEWKNETYCCPAMEIFDGGSHVKFCGKTTPLHCTGKALNFRPPNHIIITWWDFYQPWRQTFPLWQLHKRWIKIVSVTLLHQSETWNLHSATSIGIIATNGTVTAWRQIYIN